MNTAEIKVKLGPTIPWLQTLGVAVVGAFVGAALEVALSLLNGGGGVDPWSPEGLAHMGRAGLAAAIVVALAYWKQPPAGTRTQWSEAARLAERVKLEAQGRLPGQEPIATHSHMSSTATTIKQGK
jgi:hypothetical protein